MALKLWVVVKMLRLWGVESSPGDGRKGSRLLARVCRVGLLGTGRPRNKGGGRDQGAFS